MNKSSLIESNRSFVIYSYTASHGLLLLRSRKTKEISTRLDVLFQDVRAMEIRSWFTGLTIEEVGADFLKSFASNPAQMVEPGNKIYALRGIGWQGFIVAGIVSSKEDNDEFAAPSRLVAATHNG
jgi:hypothetical protein